MWNQIKVNSKLYIMATIKNLLSWKRREENLRNIKRYHKFKVMFYRTDDLIHSKRVVALLEEILPYVKILYPEIYEKLAKLIAKYHDDYEIIIKGGDIPLQYKLGMNHVELSLHQRKEVLAVERLSNSYPKIVSGYEYKNIALHAVYKESIESQVVSFVDKIDGYCEAIHEVLAGNTIFIEPIINYNLKTFNKLKELYPLIKEIFEMKDVWFNFNYIIDLIEFFEGGNIGSKPHTEETIKRRTLIPQYEMWKKVTIKKFGIEPLINQVEFHRE